MLSLFRHVTYSVFLSLAVGLLSHATCSNTVSQNLLKNDQEASDSRSLSNSELLLNKVFAKIDQRIEQNQKTQKRYSIAKKFVRKNYSTIMRLLDAYSALRVSHKLFNLTASNSVELQEIIIISLIMLVIKSNKRITSLFPHYIITSIILVLAYRASIFGTSTLIDPWTAYSIICNGLSCSTISQLSNTYGSAAIRKSAQLFAKLVFKVSKALPSDPIFPRRSASFFASDLSFIDKIKDG